MPCCPFARESRRSSDPPQAQPTTAPHNARPTRRSSGGGRPSHRYQTFVSVEFNSCTGQLHRLFIHALEQIDAIALKLFPVLQPGSLKLGGVTVARQYKQARPLRNSDDCCAPEYKVESCVF